MCLKEEIDIITAGETICKIMISFNEKKINGWQIAPQNIHPPAFMWLVCFNNYQQLVKRNAKS